MLEIIIPPDRATRIDLASVRDTLLYIESDLNHAPALSRLAVAIRSALSEIERLQDAAEIQPPAVSAARFLPAQF